MWTLFGGGSEPARGGKVNLKDRPPLSFYLSELSARELSGLDGGGGASAPPAEAALRTQSESFMVIPLQTIGKRIDHNAETAEAVLRFTEDRAKQLQRSLRDQRKRALPLPSSGQEFATGSLERTLAELNRISDSEIQQTHTRASALEMRVRQQLAAARENAVGCGADYEGELHQCERATQRAREKLQRSKVAHGRAIERLETVRTRGTEPPPPPSLLSLGRPDRRDGADNELDLAEAQQAVTHAAQQIEDDSEQLLRCLYDQDRVAAAVALAFEACDIRLRDAAAQSIRTFIDIEMEATQKRLDDLRSVAGLLDGISSAADSTHFISAARRPELTHMQSAALSLINNPDSRGAFAFSANKAERKTRNTDSPTTTATTTSASNVPAAVPSPAPSPLDGASRGSGDASDAMASKRAREEMESITAKLFADTSASPLLGDQERQQLLSLLQREEGRSALLWSLNQQRSRRTEIIGGYVELANAMTILLDHCLALKDCKTAKAGMMMAQTFYMEGGNSGGERGDRVFLKSALLSHPIWQSAAFWEESFSSALSSALKEGPAVRKWHAMTPDEMRDAVLRVHNIVFSNVGAYAHSMLEFGCDAAMARKFVLRICHIYQLQEDQRESLVRMLEGSRSRSSSRSREGSG